MQQRQEHPKCKLASKQNKKASKQNKQASKQSKQASKGKMERVSGVVCASGTTVWARGLYRKRLEGGPG